MEKEKLQKLISVIEGMKVEEKLKKSLLSFMNTYDGSKYPELFNMLNSLIMSLLQYNVYKIKAEGYDQIHASYDSFLHTVSDIKESFDALNKMELPDRLPLETNDEENNKE